MSEYRRAKMPGGTYFFTVNTFRRGKFLILDPFRNALRDGIETARITLPFTIVAWVLMPEHLHCIWRLPENDADFSTRWAIIKREVSKRCGHLVEIDGLLNHSKQFRNESVVWQRRFWEHQIRDDLDLQRHVDYIHFNPVKYGHAACVADWRYSTFHRYVQQGLYPADWAGIEDDMHEFGEQDDEVL
jgi:putative transposase